MNETIFTNEKPSGKLRFVMRAEFRILQQEWIVHSFQNSLPIGVDFEWRDVPLEEEK